MLSIKVLLHKHFNFFDVELSQTLQRVYVKLFANAKFVYRTLSNFDHTELEKLPINVKLLKHQILTFGQFRLFCQY